MAADAGRVMTCESAGSCDAGDGAWAVSIRLVCFKGGGLSARDFRDGSVSVFSNLTFTTGTGFSVVRAWYVSPSNMSNPR